MLHMMLEIMEAQTLGKRERDAASTSNNTAVSYNNATPAINRFEDRVNKNVGFAVYGMYRDR